MIESTQILYQAFLDKNRKSDAEILIGRRILKIIGVLGIEDQTTRRQMKRKKVDARESKEAAAVAEDEDRVSWEGHDLVVGRL